MSSCSVNSFAPITTACAAAAEHSPTERAAQARTAKILELIISSPLKPTYIRVAGRACGVATENGRVLQKRNWRGSELERRSTPIADNFGLSSPAVHNDHPCSLCRRVQGQLSRGYRSYPSRRP